MAQDNELMSVLVPKEIVLEMVRAQMPPPPVPPPVPPPGLPPVKQVCVVYPEEIDFKDKSIIHNTLIRAASFDPLFRCLVKSFDNIIVRGAVHQIVPHLRTNKRETQRGHFTAVFNNTITGEESKGVHIFVVKIQTEHGDFWSYDGLSWNYVEVNTRVMTKHSDIYMNSV